jgi:quinol monooxygenase YgiN
MTTVTIEMKLRPEKRQEMLITLHELTELMREEKGFMNARVSMNGGNNNVLKFIEEWATQEDVHIYMQSNYFQVLRGAMKVLTSSWEIDFSMEGNTSSETNLMPGG